jgi:hypothetical protein
MCKSFFTARSPPLESASFWTQKIGQNVQKVSYSINATKVVLEYYVNFNLKNQVSTFPVGFVVFVAHLSFLPCRLVACRLVDAYAPGKTTTQENSCVGVSDSIAAM